MAAKVLTVTYQDAALRHVTLTYSIGAGYAADDAETLALLQALQDLSQANITEASVAEPVDVSGLTGSQPATGGNNDQVSQQAIVQFDRSDLTGKIRISVPAPVDAIFQTSGKYTGRDIVNSQSLIVALVAAGITEPVLKSPQDTTLVLDKGWLRGEPHS